MLIALIILEIVIVLTVPFLLGAYLRRWHGTSWVLFGIGAVTFIASQVVHIPLNYGLTALFRQPWMPGPAPEWRLAFNAVVLGLTAGLCEETARYLVLRFWARTARTWRQGVMFGAGHGGIESVLVGLTVALTLVNMIVLRTMDVSALPLPPEQAAVAAAQVEAFWQTPLYLPLLAAAERLMAMLLHIALATLIMHGVVRKRLWPLWVAIAWHALANAVTVYVNGTWGPVASEGALAVLSLGSVALLWATRRAASNF